MYGGKIMKFLALFMLGGLIGFVYYCLHPHDFIDEQLSQYDSTKTKPATTRQNVLDDPGLIYQADLGALYNTEPVVLIGEKK